MSVYVMLFGFNTAPFFDMTSSYVNLIPPLHACSLNAIDIRQEVDNLKTDFNNRMKQILFHSFLNAYYAGFIPCCFAQSFLFYDITWATQHFFFVFLGCFTAFSLYMLPLRYCDTLHRAALHLGKWDKIETRAILPVAYTWQEDLLWPQGILVRHGKDMYKALGDSNAAEPGNVSYSRFYVRVLCIFLQIILNHNINVILGYFQEPVYSFKGSAYAPSHSDNFST